VWAFRTGAGRCYDDLQAHAPALKKATSGTDKIISPVYRRVKAQHLLERDHDRCDP
jgi:hypothetical protein